VQPPQAWQSWSKIIHLPGTTAKAWERQKSAQTPQ
jgi:hypothetical protein